MHYKFIDSFFRFHVYLNLYRILFHQRLFCVLFHWACSFATGSNYGIDTHTLCPCLNCVQVAFAVLISWMIFRNPISVMNAVGCAITLVGCTFYGYVRHLLSQQPPPPGTPRTPKTPRNRMELLPLVNDKLDDKV
jgi:multidrug transporter EmrE-like cation transporter